MQRMMEKTERGKQSNKLHWKPHHIAYSTHVARSSPGTRSVFISTIAFVPFVIIASLQSDKASSVTTHYPVPSSLVLTYGCCPTKLHSGQNIKHTHYIHKTLIWLWLIICYCEVDELAGRLLLRPETSLWSPHVSQSSDRPSSSSGFSSSAGTDRKNDTTDWIPEGMESNKKITLTQSEKRGHCLDVAQNHYC